MPSDSELVAQLAGGDFKQFLLATPEAFILHYFPERIEKLETFHLELIDVATNEARGLVLYPAGHGKTTLVSTLLPIWAMCANPNIRIGAIFKNEDEAGNVMRLIQSELTTNHRLIEDFGPFHDEDDKNKPWALGSMTIAGRTKNFKEPTLAVFGSGARTVLGHRTDWTICDDVVTDKNSPTPTQRSSLRNWFDLAVETGPEFTESRLTVVGTLFDPEDLYHDLMEMFDPETGEPIWKIRQIDAIVDEEEQTTLWPERWPWRRLMRTKAKLGTLNFNKRYRNIAVDASRMVFKEQYVTGGYIGRDKYPGCLDRSLKIGEYDETWRRAAGFDPAVGLTRSAKFCAHLTLACGSCKEHERCYWVIDLERDQFTLPQQIELILSRHQRYDLMKSMVEANSYQGGLFQAIEAKMKENGFAFRVEPHYTTRTNKPDPEVGVQSMSKWFETGAVHIPWGDLHSQRKMRQLVDELVQYPGRTTDTVMAFWFAWKALEESGPKYKSFNRLDKPMAWNRYKKHGGRRVVKNPIYT